MGERVRVVMISDTHMRHDRVVIPDGDILIHAGDFSRRGSLEDLAEVDAFLGRQPHSHRVFIAGNHDFCFERTPEQARSMVSGAIYLQDSGVELMGLRIWGSPWQPVFFNWAFNLPRGEALRERWTLIPDDTDVLVTHGPPMGHGDVTSRGERVGCEELLEAIRRVRPRLHVFGHIHEDHGVSWEGETACVNASVCTLSYEAEQSPLVADLVRGASGGWERASFVGG